MPLGCGIGVGTPFIQSTGESLPPFPWTPDFTPFRFEVQTDAPGGSGSTSIRLPFRPLVATKQASLATGWAIDVDWGDGNTTSYTSFPATDYQVSHTYSSAGLYEISISMNAAATVNTLKGWSYGPSATTNANDAGKFVRVLNWGIFDFAADVIGDSGNQEDSDTAYYFNNIKNTEKWKPTFPPHISGTSLRGLWSGEYFRDFGQFNKLKVFKCPYLSQWDISGVQSLQETFTLDYQVSTSSSGLPIEFRQDWIEVKDWDVSNVTNMRKSFYKQYQLLGPEVAPWDVANVTDMSSMFQECISFNGDIDSWDVGNVTDMSFMFSDAAIFDEYLGSWNTSNVTDMSFMFYASYNNTVSFGSGGDRGINNWNVSSVTTMESMFEHNEVFNMPIGSWSPSNVTTMESMFSSAITFNQPIDNWNLSSLTNTSIMFLEAASFDQYLGSWNMSNVTNFVSMFNLAQSFGTGGDRGLGNWNMSSAVNLESMFANCSNFNDDIGAWNTTSVTNMQQMFTINTGFGVFNQDISSWDMSNVDTVTFMFFNQTSFNQDLPSWDLSSVGTGTTYSRIGLSGMFKGCTSFNGDISGWNVSNVQQMYNMFEDATSFNQNINSWNVSNCFLFHEMFKGATSFNQPLDSWDVSKATSYFQYGGLKGMFENASSFDQYLGSWTPTLNFQFENMFKGATSFGTGGDRGLGNWTFRTGSHQGGRTVDMTSMFEGCTNFNDDISSWGVSNVYKFENTLKDATSFNQDLSSWDMTGTHLVLNTNPYGSIKNMFLGATSIDFDMSSWNLKETGNIHGFMGDPNNITANDPTLSVSNYDATLVAFGARVPYTNIISSQDDNYFTFGNSKYTGTDTAVVAGRNALISDLGDLVDGGAV